MDLTTIMLSDQRNEDLHCISLTLLLKEGFVNSAQQLSRTPESF